MTDALRAQVVQPVAEAEHDRLRVLAEHALLFDDIRTIAVSITNSDSPYTALETDHMIFVDCSGGAVTINLPPVADVAGKQYIIKKTETSGNNITLDPNGAEPIEGGGASSTLAFGAGARNGRVISNDGAEWWVLAAF